LNKKAEFIQDTYKQRHDAHTVNQMHSFMKKFKTAHQEHTLLQSHINLAEKIALCTKSTIFDQRIEIEHALVDGQDGKSIDDYLEAVIAKQEPFSNTLRLLCLNSLTRGLNQKKFDFFKREIIQTYGFDKLFTLNNLEMLGMFRALTKKNNWQQIKKSLKLVQDKDKVELKNPTDITYAYSGYGPLSVRLVELAAKGGWKKMEETLNLIPGKTFEYTQELPAAIQSRSRMTADSNYHLNPLPSTTSTTGAPSAVTTNIANANNITQTQTQGQAPSSNSASSTPASTSVSEERKKPLTVVYFIGGVTFGEISALRHLSERENHGRDYIIATTKLINGVSLIDSITETLTNRLKKNTVK